MASVVPGVEPYFIHQAIVNLSSCIKLNWDTDVPASAVSLTPSKDNASSIFPVAPYVAPVTCISAALPRSAALSD